MNIYTYMQELATTHFPFKNLLTLSSHFAEGQQMDDFFVRWFLACKARDLDVLALSLKPSREFPVVVIKTFL